MDSAQSNFDKLNQNMRRELEIGETFDLYHKQYRTAVSLTNNTNNSSSWINMSIFINTMSFNIKNELEMNIKRIYILQNRVNLSESEEFNQFDLLCKVSSVQSSWFLDYHSELLSLNTLKLCGQCLPRTWMRLTLPLNSRGPVCNDTKLLPETFSTDKRDQGFVQLPAITGFYFSI